MDPRERLRLRSGEMSCSACGSPLTADAMRVLAERDDLAFVELPCRGCGATTLEMIAPDPSDASGDARDRSRPTADPIGIDDVLAMRRLLAGWDGDLRALVERRHDGRGRASVEP